MGKRGFFRRCICALLALRVEHLHVGCNDLGGIAFDALLVVPGLGLDAPLQINQLSFDQVFSADLGQFPESDDLVPLGLFFILHASNCFESARERSRRGLQRGKRAKTEWFVSFTD
jgi:hypothetical protein